MAVTEQGYGKPVGIAKEPLRELGDLNQDKSLGNGDSDAFSITQDLASPLYPSNASWQGGGRARLPAYSRAREARQDRQAAIVIPDDPSMCSAILTTKHMQPSLKKSLNTANATRPPVRAS